MAPDSREIKTISEEANVEATINDYFVGMHQRDLARLRLAFHPSAKLFGHIDGVFIEMSLDEWLAKVQSRPIPAECGEPFDMAILRVEVTGDVAAVKVRNLYRGLRFTDYLHLAKLDGQWRIVNKTFHHE